MNSTIQNTIIQSLWLYKTYQQWVSTFDVCDLTIFNINTKTIEEDINVVLRNNVIFLLNRLFLNLSKQLSGITKERLLYPTKTRYDLVQLNEFNISIKSFTLWKIYRTLPYQNYCNYENRMNKGRKKKKLLSKQADYTRGAISTNIYTAFQEEKEFTK